MLVDNPLKGVFMTEEVAVIPFEEFSHNLDQLFEQVIHDQKAVVVENAKGERAVLKPLVSRKLKSRARTEEDYKVFLASLGGWKDVDIDQFLKDNDTSRKPRWFAAH